MYPERKEKYKEEVAIGKEEQGRTGWSIGRCFINAVVGMMNKK